jgi:hypothetical protein
MDILLNYQCSFNWFLFLEILETIFLILPLQKYYSRQFYILINKKYIRCGCFTVAQNNFGDDISNPIIRSGLILN